MAISFIGRHLPESPFLPELAAVKDTWRIFRIMAELVEGFETLSQLPRGVTVFGAARSRPGDPDYARRFAASTRLYDGDGFEVNEPLATKMEAQPHDARPFDLLKPPYRYDDYEFERYWHFFQVFGRLGYNPDTPPEVWQREFLSRLPRGGVLP